MTFSLEAKITEIRIERQRMRRAAERASRRSVVRSLAFIRTKTRSNVLRRRKKVSQPGKPPSVHSKDPTKSLKKIRFDYDNQSMSGVVGPVHFKANRYGVRSQTTTPNTLEFGGTLTYFEEYVPAVGAWTMRRKSRSRKNYEQRTRRVTIQPRQFMSVGVQRVEEEGKLLAPWKGSVTG